MTFRVLRCTGVAAHSDLFHPSCEAEHHCAKGSTNDRLGSSQRSAILPHSFSTLRNLGRGYSSAPPITGGK